MKEPIVHYGFNYESGVPRKGGTACGVNGSAHSQQTYEITCSACLREMIRRGTVMLNYTSDNIGNISIRGHVSKRPIIVKLPFNSQEALSIQELDERNRPRFELEAFLIAKTQIAEAFVQAKAEKLRVS